MIESCNFNSLVGHWVSLDKSCVDWAVQALDNPHQQIRLFDVLGSHTWSHLNHAIHTYYLPLAIESLYPINLVELFQHLSKPEKRILVCLSYLIHRYSIVSLHHLLLISHSNLRYWHVLLVYWILLFIPQCNQVLQDYHEIDYLYLTLIWEVHSVLWIIVLLEILFDWYSALAQQFYQLELLRPLADIALT